MKKHFTTKSMSIALLLSVVTVIFPLTVSADEDSPLPEEYSQYIVEEEPFEFEYLPGDLTHEELKTAVLNPAEKPAVISQAQIDGMQHVNRLYEQEPDEYTVIFQNRDGGKTVYVFDRPVKSTSESGEVCDLSANTIVVASKKNTQLSSFSLNNAAGESISAPVSAMKQMQARLEAYKSALGLNEYQMLNDVFETETLTARGLASELSSPMQITESDSVSVANLSVTYNRSAGEFGLKGTASNKFMTCIGGNLSTYTNLLAPFGKWVFIYVNTNQYVISPQSKQNYCIGTSGTSVGLYQIPSNLSNVPSNMIWNLSESGDNVKICQGSMALSESFVLMPVNKAPYWLRTNYSTAVYIQNLELPEYLYVDYDNYFSPPSVEVTPSNASYADPYTDFDWYATNGTVEYDGSDFYAMSCGTVEIYCKHKYSDLESGRVTVIVKEQAFILSGATYLIRPYSTNITYASPILTMNIGSTMNTNNYLNLSSYQTMADPNDSNNTIAKDEDWKTFSRAFSITQIGNGNTYRISAIMSTNQYGNGKTYKYRAEQQNTLYISDTKQLLLKKSGEGNGDSTVPNDTDISQQWKITECQGKTYFESVKYPGYCINYNGNSVSVVNTSTIVNTSNIEWKLSFFGLDVPLINQTGYGNCIPTSSLQALYVINPSMVETLRPNDETLEGKIKGITYDVFNYIDWNDNTMVVGSQAGITTAAAKLNANGANYTTTTSSPTANQLPNKIQNSLLNNHPVLASINTFIQAGVPYLPYNPNKLGKHVICIIGCDTDTGLIAISECFPNTLYVGIHLVTPHQLYGALRNGMIFHNSIGG